MDGAKTAHEVVAEYKRHHRIDEAEFQEWFRDGSWPQDHANVHDSRHLALLETFVEERDAAASTTGSTPSS